ncbi:MAG: protein kinase domain-containing protein, partial [Prochlorotrichaceae cyanobacterium]
MPEFPDFSAQGLQIIHELGRNPGGGRVTYLARTAQGHSVVLKQFQFAKGGNWTGFKAIERETQTLRDLKHPGIPRYLGSFETDDGFCLVQEYKEARPLSEPRSFNPDEIKQIATKLLEILVYLQERIPQVFHRDIKPENVLVSDNLQVYLIDFGFARIGGENLAMSSVAMGTFGFMAPEQTRNLQLTPASDLYGLGLTLVCVIAQLKSHEIGEYVDWSNQLDQKAIEAKIKGCSFRFIEWLNQMVAPDPKKRFPDAATALEALKPLYVKRTPEVKLSCTTLNFEATKVGEKLSQTITLTNSVPETVLEGHWEVAPHPNDPPHTPDRHPWISFSPKTVQGNEVTCKVTVDTSHLQTERQGSRQLILHCNAKNPENLILQVWTASNAWANFSIKQYLMEACYLTYILISMMIVGTIFSLYREIFPTVGLVIIAPIIYVSSILASAYIIWLVAWFMAGAMVLRSIIMGRSKPSDFSALAMYGSKLWAIGSVGFMIIATFAAGSSLDGIIGIILFSLVAVNILSNSYILASSLIISLTVILVGLIVELSVVNIWTIFLTLTGFFLSLNITGFYENFTKPEKHKIYLRFWLRYFFS